MAVAAESASPLDVVASLGQNKNTKTLLRVIILALIAAAAIASRLFSVIRMLSSTKLRLACPMHRNFSSLSSALHLSPQCCLVM
jgi:hypothetical protein